MSSSKAFKPIDYTIGLMTVLPCEMAAAIAILDSTHDRPKIPHDDNFYAAGSIGPHNVIIASSGEAGTNPANNCATNMLRSFPNIRVGLLVGIGGGVPSSKNDIRLGDVVVSQPGNGHGGVAFYDPGKLTESGFQPTGHLDRPPAKLRKAATWLQTQRIAGDTTFDSLLADIARVPAYRFPESSPDVLYDASDTAKIISREVRPTTAPHIHYGLIASGSWVIKSSGSKRADLISQVNGDVLCFEMEAAALMNTFPCLVIRGISDYCDSYKNDGWHHYASATAACYAKWLLKILTPEEISETALAVTTTDNSREFNRNQHMFVPKHRNTKLATTAQRALDAYDRREAWSIVGSDAGSWITLLNRLSDYHHEKAQRRIARQRTPNTTDWFVDSDFYQSWSARDGSFEDSCLWLSGDIGFGKTLICARVIDHQRHLAMKTQNAVAFIYCDPSERRTLDPSYVLASLVKQVLLHYYQLHQHIQVSQRQALHSFYTASGKVPDFEDIETMFIDVYNAFAGTTFIVDGLHELDQYQLRKILPVFRRAARENSLAKLFITSRDDPKISCVPYRILPDATRGDIARFIDSELEDPISDDMKLVQRLKRELVERAGGMFLWVRLQIEALRLDCKTDGDIRTALNRLPRSLSETYQRCLARAERTDPTLARKAFLWIFHAVRPLSMPELLEALAIEFSDTCWDQDKVPLKSRLLEACSNLVVEDFFDSTVRYTHPSVKAIFLWGADAPREFFQFNSHDRNYPGEVCVAYLSFDDFSQGLQRMSTRRTNVILPSPMQSVTATLSGTSGLVSRVLFGYPGASDPAVNATFSIRQAIPQPKDSNKYAFLNYARQEWAAHTKFLSANSSMWRKFRTLSLQQNAIWEFQPWAPTVLSHHAYLHALLAWATRNDHKPLLSIFLDELQQNRDRKLRELCNLPYAQDGMPALHIAARLGFVGIITPLMQFCDVNVAGPQSMTPLHFAAEKDHTEVVTLLLFDKRLKPDLLSASRESPIAVAVRLGSFAVLEVLCNRKDININWTDRNGTLLHMAIHKGYSRVADFLIHDTEIDVNARDEAGATALILAAGKGSLVIVKALLHRPDLRRRAWCSSLGTPLIQAAEIGNLEIAQQLVLRAEGDMNVVRGDGLSALAIAAARGNADMAKYIASCSGVDLDPQDLRGDTPLHLAVKGGHVQAAQMLMPITKLDLRNKAGDTALFIAVRNHDLGIVKPLLDWWPRYNVNTVDENGRTALFLAARSGSPDVLLALLDCPGVDVNWVDQFRRSAVFDAIYSQSAENVELLVQHERTLLNLSDLDLQTPLICAARYSSLVVVRKFLALPRNMIKYNAADGKGQTPLLAAVRCSNADIASELASIDIVDLHVRDHFGLGVFDYAAKNGLDEVVRVILQRPDIKQNLYWHNARRAEIKEAIRLEFDQKVMELQRDYGAIASSSGDDDHKPGPSNKAA